MTEKQMPEIERRSFTVAELRASAENEPPKISGYAAVFNQLSEDLGGFRERIDPGAFAKTLGEADVRSLWNHDPNYVLGRTRSGTLKLSEDDHGLAYDVTPPDTSWARDLLISMRRGDVNQMSFGFNTIRDKWEQIGDQVVRTLLEVRLFDVSPVTYPAYPQTSAQVRSIASEFTRAASAPGQEAHPENGEMQPQAGRNLRQRLNLAKAHNQI